jgi:cytochrome c oxidase subunit 2
MNNPQPAKVCFPVASRSPSYASCLVALAFSNSASAAHPLDYLTSAGTKANAILPLTWGLLTIAVAVVLIITTLTVVAITRRRTVAAEAIANPPHDRDASKWIYVGVGISTVVLAISLVWTIRVLAHVNTPAHTAMNLEITAQQWWWKVRYLSDDPSRVLITANEIHIPTGQPIRINLIADDVIHSFWVPALAGKTDLIPGQTNVAWIEADEPGRYRGQCAEYCGVQHAHMAFEVVAEPPDEFAHWFDSQLAPAAENHAQTSAGEKTFEFRCGPCHTVRGTPAGGTAAPDLTHLMTRASIAAVTLPNNVGAVSAWIANPQAIKPGTHMPVLQLSPAEIRDLDAFLMTLR